MDKNPLVSRLNKVVPGAILETRRFGRSASTSIWVEAQSIQKIAIALKIDEEMKLDWLENLSVVEFESVFVVTYFVRSTVTQHHFVIRASAVPSSPDSKIPFLSVRVIWPMATLMEDEAEEMFGIEFRLNGEIEAAVKSSLLPEDWKGFPLRKNYTFPKEFFGITHFRPFNRSSQKKLLP